MPFNQPNPSLAELDTRMQGVEASVKTLEPSTFITPAAGVGAGSVKWDLNPTQLQVAQLASGSAVTLTTGTPTYYNITQLTLPAGRWRITGVVSFRQVSGAVQMTFTAVAASTDSATLPPDGEYATGLYAGAAIAGALGIDQPIVERILNFSGTTTVYLIARAGWNGGGVANAFGKLQAELLP